MISARSGPDVHPLLSVLFAACFTLLAADHARAEQKAADFTLPNGMRVVVIPDHRLPVVTHMVWYRAGAADDPPGVSGIAHFLEHLMFKSTQRMKSGEFARTISRLGGRDNASTVHDTTTYFERAAKEHLRTLMQLEADRMVNLRLTEEEVRTEREVIKEERRSNVDADPVSVLSEQMLTVLYRSHPYRRPVLGFADEMSRLTRQDAIAFYRRFYAPNNAILVVAGDVTPEEVKTLAEATYGRNKANPAVVRAAREPEPAPTTSRRVHLEDARAGTSMLLRYYQRPELPLGAGRGGKPAGAGPDRGRGRCLAAIPTAGGDEDRGRCQLQVCRQRSRQWPTDIPRHTCGRGGPRQGRGRARRHHRRASQDGGDTAGAGWRQVCPRSPRRVRV